MHDRRLRKIVILGGGTAGWMTAAALSKTLPQNSCNIALVESDEIATIGVGEATIPTIHWFNRLVGLNEAEFLRETKATFKLGIEFRDWYEPGHSYLHPFGTYGVPLNGISFQNRWIKANQEGFSFDHEDFSLATVAARAGRFSHPSTDPRSLLSTLGYAYHFDASLYARYMRGLSEKEGVERIEGKVIKVVQDSQTGFITSLLLDNGKEVSGDLFIDCSGLRSMLLGDTLDVGFDDWSHWLPCDRALAVPCEGVPTIEPNTRSTARDAGWQWRIPLQHRIGNGYVYSSAFTDDDAALRVLMDNLDGKALAEPKPIRFRTGCRTKIWEKNVVAIGLSSCFLEPLESTSIHLIQSGIAKLLALLPNRDCDPLLAEQFNRLFRADADNVKDFLILHYHATRNKEQPLWAYCRNMELPDSLTYREKHFQRTGRIMLDPEELFREDSWFAVLIGQGIRPADYNILADTLDKHENCEDLELMRDAVRELAGKMPTHNEYVRRICG
jgi:tryptophan 7-halogenase